jgi:protein-tyrosine phosphatase
MHVALPPLIELPFGLPGRIFRSPMPFRAGDSQGEVFYQYLEQRVTVVVVLVDDDECLARTGRDLRQFYKSNGLEVIHLPIPDFAVPTQQALHAAIETTLDRACAGKNIAVHCYAGYGRTGMYLACMARRVLEMSAKEAIAWVRSYVPTAIEVPEQVEIVNAFGGYTHSPVLGLSTCEENHESKDPGA